MRKIAIMWLCTSSSILAGCVPIVSPYHQVSATEGTVNKSSCSPISGDPAGPPSILKLQDGAVKIDIDGTGLSGLDSIGSDPSISIEFVVPTGNKIAITWDQIKAIDNINHQPVQLTLDSFVYPDYKRYSVDWVQLQPGAVLDGNVSPYALHYWDEPSTIFTLRYKITSGVPQDFSFIFPNVSINGTSYPGFIVQFQHKVGLWCAWDHGPFLLVPIH